MSGISKIDEKQLRGLIEGFNGSYAADWACWQNTEAKHRPMQLASILRRWQACRPNRMIRSEHDRHRDPLTLSMDSLVASCTVELDSLRNFSIVSESKFEDDHISALKSLWLKLEYLSFHGKVRGGKAGLVGISKATMLLTNGKVGPAFDSKVKKALKIEDSGTSNGWISALETVRCDIQEFQKKTNCDFYHLSRNVYKLEPGRIYDMALGPR